MTTIEVYLSTADVSDNTTPYIVDDIPISYECDGKEGLLRFKGYYRVENHPPPYPEEEGLKPQERPRRYTEWLPRNLMLYYKKRETGPIGECNILEHFLYHIEVYKIIDHNKQAAFFFPENEVTLYFRVLGTL
jgi:hypothetical protein